jgi:hypothetical protein
VVVRRGGQVRNRRGVGGPGGDPPFGRLGLVDGGVRRRVEEHVDAGPVVRGDRAGVDDVEVGAGEDDGVGQDGAHCASELTARADDRGRHPRPARSA